MKVCYILEKLRDLLFPPKCLLCSDATAAGKSELCDNCLCRWQNLTEVKCPRCGNIARECRCNFRHLDDAKCAGALFFYDRAAEELADGKRLIYSLKRSRDRRIVRFLSRETAAMLLKYCVSRGIDISSALVTGAPRSKEAVREYGFDHAEELARHTARHMGAEYKSLFANKGGTVQKTLSAAERKDNSESAILLKGSLKPGTVCILIDDVITTGATLGRCAALLRDSGAGDVICATVASARSKNTAGLHPAPESDDGLWFQN